ncbi:MAG: preprotein translocase subunit SecE [Ignavibacteria bacterium GWF2_33_9]|nr:MAG: preprotein translocase subunit SecE [Ignavibacteria bacterium GWF2_33_9]
MVKKIKSFVNDVVVEMKKVTWPTREQLMESTRVVIGTSLIITSIVFVVDQVTTWVYSFLF